MNENDLLEGREARFVEVFDHLDQGRCVEPVEAAVAVGQTRLDQRDTLALPIRQLVEMHATGSAFKCSGGPNPAVRTGDVTDRRDPKERLGQSALTTAQVEHTRRSSSDNSGNDSLDSLLVQTDALLDLMLFAIAFLVDLRLVIDGVIGETGQHIVGERTAVLEVPATDQLAGRMGGQPRAALEVGSPTQMAVFTR